VAGSSPDYDGRIEHGELYQDIASARRIQRGFLPASPPEVLGYQFFDCYEPARELSGDFFDYVELPGGRLAVVVADVSGKGISASLLMAKFSSEVRRWLVAEPEPAVALERLNRVFARGRWSERFITLVVNVIHFATHEVTILRAGHPAPLRHRPNGQLEVVGQEVGGLPLGILEESRYDSCTITLAPGEFITCYTDGVPDALNERQERYGLDRLAALLTGEHESAVAIGMRIRADVAQFIGACGRVDDIAMVCYGRNGNGDHETAQGRARSCEKQPDYDLPAAAATGLVARRAASQRPSHAAGSKLVPQRADPALFHQAEKGEPV
jgi:sigma-B regulation protein RsbU (phosphoserine phosphatase)